MGIYRRFEALQEALKLDALPQRIECFDISHTQGEAAVASCVVFDPTGALKKAYRHFNISGITPGDDYGAMHQAILRRYSRMKLEEATLPDILFIDGGKGQLREVEKVLEELQITSMTVLAISKGTSRKPGFETLWLSGADQPLQLASDSPALHLIQHIRDEAHRFAIRGHRRRRAKARSTSSLENIPGIGAKKRQELLRQLGGMQEVHRASIDELRKVPGISEALAKRIYEALHGT
jgi:excinuclease ABC subunit C